MFFHLIIKSKNTFNTSDFPYCTSLTISGTNYSVTYSTTSALSDTQTATFAFADYFAYVVPTAEV